MPHSNAVSHPRDLCHTHTALYLALYVSCVWQCTWVTHATHMSHIYSVTHPRRMPHTYSSVCCSVCLMCVAMHMRHTHVAHIQCHTPETYAANIQSLTHVPLMCEAYAHTSHTCRTYTASRTRDVCHKQASLYLALCVACVQNMHIYHTHVAHTQCLAPETRMPQTKSSASCSVCLMRVVYARMAHTSDVCNTRTALYLALYVSCVWQCTCVTHVTHMSHICSVTHPRHVRHKLTALCLAL